MMDEKTENGNAKVLVIGGGVAGIKTSLDLAEAGRDVVLIDQAPSIGGLMTQLDRTFPTNNCDMCTLSPHLAESGREQRIELLPLTTLASFTGEPGNFQAEVVTRPRYIDMEKCTACGDCLKQYPECVNFNPGLDHRAPTCMRYPQSTPLAYSIDPENCSDPEGLVACCRVGAINLDEAPGKREIRVGSVVLAAGASLFDATLLPHYGYGALPNVVTGLDYERIMSASGPTGGELIRPSDGKRPEKVAWIQCVGSRNINQADTPYCSGVCCMYALKEAIVSKERFRDDLEAVVFYMDMRTSGKNYELYLNRAQDDFQVRLVRCRPHSVDAIQGSEDLSITYFTEDQSEPQTEVFDMVVLSTGFMIPPETIDLARVLGIELNQHNFAETGYFQPTATSRAGVYVCGLTQSPKDIPETMVQAGAAAGQAARHLSSGPDKSEPEDETPPERDVEGEEPRLGVFVCDCGENIGGVIDTEELRTFLAGQPGVVVAENIGHGCSRESLSRVEAAVKENRLNRVVIGGCSPRTHEVKFQDSVRRAGLNKYLVEMANIRDQAAWVHQGERDVTMKKVRELMLMALSGAVRRRPLTDYSLPMNKDVLVVGGGVTGLNSALSLAEQGLKVYLVENSRTLGGQARQVRKTLTGEDVQAYLNELIDKATSHPLIEVLTDSMIVDHSGRPGLFKTGIQRGPSLAYRQIDHGATILAAGARANRPQEYMLDENPAVRTQLELEALIEDDPQKVKDWRNLVMIQCVGSRTPENPNCSRVCCQSAIKNALAVRALNPDARIFILFRDMRTPGFQELFFRQARESGIIFVRYQPDQKPQVQAADGKVKVGFTDPVLGMDLEVDADCLALSTGFIADDENTEDLAAIFRLPRTDDGYWLEEHVKLAPLDLPVPGFLAAGAAHSPKSISESITQGQAAAGRVLALLARDSINLGAASARVDGKKCAACLICVRACPFGVPFINAEGYSEIDPAKCHGCGVCAAECPAKAIELLRYEDDFILAELDGLLAGLMRSEV